MPTRPGPGSRLSRWRYLHHVALLAVATAPVGGTSARPGSSGPTVWVAPSTLKVRPADAVPSQRATAAQIQAARNEFEAFQVIVSGTAQSVSAQVTIPFSYTSTVTGGTKAMDFRLYREALLNLMHTSSSDPESATGYWPDALVPDHDQFFEEQRNAFPFDIRGANQGIWAEVFVPPDAPAGAYQAAVTVSAGGKLLATVGVYLTVWNFTLDPTASAKSAYGLSYGALPTAFGFDGSSSANSDLFAKLRHMFGAMALDHRVSLSSHDDGLWYDLNHFVQYYGDLVDGCLTYPPAPAGPAKGCIMQGAKLTNVQYLGPPSGSTLASDLQRWVTFYGSTFGGSDPLFHYTADEPNASNGRWASVFANAPVAHATTPPVRTLVTTSLSAAQQQSGTNSVTGQQTTADQLIDVIVPAINYMDPFSYPYGQESGVRQTYDGFVANQPPDDAKPANEMWLYQSCMSHDCGGTGTSGIGWPSYMIDAYAVRNRAMQWLMYAYRTSGELYYDTGYAMSAKRDAWTDQWEFTGNGDCNLFYPGTVAKIGGSHAIPVASIRLKMIREGMENDAYLKLLEQIAPTEALALAQQLFPYPNNTGARTPDDLAKVRAYVACRIVEGTATTASCTSPQLATVAKPTW